MKIYRNNYKAGRFSLCLSSFIWLIWTIFGDNDEPLLFFSWEQPTRELKYVELLIRCSLPLGWNILVEQWVGPIYGLNEFTSFIKPIRRTVSWCAMCSSFLFQFAQWIRYVSAYALLSFFFHFRTINLLPKNLCQLPNYLVVKTKAYSLFSLWAVRTIVARSRKLLFAVRKFSLNYIIRRNFILAMALYLLVI